MRLYLEHERLCIHYDSVKSWPINLNTDRFLEIKIWTIRGESVKVVQGIKCTTNKQITNKTNRVLFQYKEVLCTTFDIYNAY